MPSLSRHTTAACPTGDGTWLLRRDPEHGAFDTGDADLGASRQMGPGDWPHGVADLHAPTPVDDRLGQMEGLPEVLRAASVEGRVLAGVRVSPGIGTPGDHSTDAADRKKQHLQLPGRVGENQHDQPGDYAGDRKP